MVATGGCLISQSERGVGGRAPGGGEPSSLAQRHGQGSALKVAVDQSEFGPSQPCPIGASPGRTVLGVRRSVVLAFTAALCVACGGGRAPTVHSPTTHRDAALGDADAADPPGRDAADPPGRDAADPGRDAGPAPDQGFSLSCGDGVLSSLEECEGFELRGEDCQSQGFYEGTIHCSASCRLDTNDCRGRCGDGVINGSEGCDDGVNDSSYGHCRSDCSAPADRCGDGVVNGPEICDDRVNDGHYGGCAPGCLSLAPRCGDGTINGTEECDGRVGGDSCQNHNYDLGSLSCTSGCQLDLSGCSHTFNQISAGDWHACGLRNNNEVVCWGHNASGETTVPAGTYRAVSAGASFTCAIRSNASLACWGANNFGRAIPPSGSFTAVSAGGTHGCGIRTDRTLSCWGGERSELTAAPTTHHFTAISAGRNLSCAVDVEIQGFTVCWPDAGLAFGANTVVSVASGDHHACAIDIAGLLRCAGANDANQATPPTAHAYSRVACGYKHCCAIRTTGEIDCWGDGTQGQLSAPAGTFIDVAAGFDFSCALRGDHTAVCWGNNASGQSTPL